MKSNRGITLVALVITIIVLLILAGVSISLVVGDNGIMTRAKTSAEKTKEADALSAFQLAVSSLTSDYYAKLYTGTAAEVEEVTNTTNAGTAAKYVEGKIDNELKKAGYSGTMTTAADGTGTITVKKDPAVTGDAGVKITYKVSGGEITSIDFAS